MNLSRALQSAFIPSRLPVPTGGGLERAPIVGPAMVGRFNGINGTQMAEWDAETAVRQAYLVNWIVYRCVCIISETIASLPIRVGKDPLKPNDFDVDLPLARLLGPPPGGPNPDTSPSDLWANAIAQYIVTGRFGWEIEWSGKPKTSEVVALWPLVSACLMPKPSQGGNRYFSEFEYRTQGDRVKTLSWEQCFYHWRPSLTDWRQPESPIQAARNDIAGLVEQSIYDYAFLRNGSVPASLVVTQAFGSKESFDAFRAQWTNRYGGSANAGKTAFLEMDAEDGNVGQMVDVKLLGTSQRDADVFRRNEQKTKAICAALGVPRGKLDSGDRTYSNVEEEDKTFEKNLIIPLATKLQEAINIRLAPFMGKEMCWFELDGLTIIQERKKARNYQPQAPKDAFADGVTSLNEYRGALGEPPLDDDLANVVPLLEKLKNPEPEPKEIEAPKDDKEEPQEDKETEDKPTTKARIELVRAPGRGVMVALMIDGPTANAIAVEDGEPASSLHVTLAYLGKMSDGVDRELLESTVKDFAATQVPLAGKIGGKGVFETPDGLAVVGLVDAPGLDDMRHGLVAKLEALEIPVANNHSYTPHVTLAYVDDYQQATKIDASVGTALIWNAITVAWGATQTPFPMSARRNKPLVGDERGFSLAPEDADDSTGNASASDQVQSEDDAEEAEAQRVKQWRSLDAQAVALEKVWERSFLALFDKQAESTVSRLEGKRGRQMLRAGDDLDPNEIFRVEYWTEETAERAAGLYESVAAVSGAKLIDQLDIAFDVSAEFVQDFILERSNQLAGQVTETTYNAIKEQLALGVSKGEGIDKLSRRIRHIVGLDPQQAMSIANLIDELAEDAELTVEQIEKKVGRATKKKLQERAERIAQTEVISAYNGNTDLVGNSLGEDVVAGKEWLAARDDRVRAAHRNADGQTVAVHESFRVGGSLLPYPGWPGGPPELVIRCRCTLVLLTPDQMAERRSREQYRRVEEVEAELLRLAAIGAAA